MTIEEIRRKIKKEYVAKLNKLTDDNFELRKKIDALKKENKILQQKVEQLEYKENHRNKRIESFFDIMEKMK